MMFAGLILPCCGKGVDGSYTQLAHGDHVGFLCDGKVRPCSVLFRTRVLIPCDSGTRPFLEPIPAEAFKTPGWQHKKHARTALLKSGV